MVISLVGKKVGLWLLVSIYMESFTGYGLLSWMYISWSIFEPSMLSQMKLDFDEEYKLAKRFKK